MTTIDVWPFVGQTTAFASGVAFVVWVIRCLIKGQLLWHTVVRDRLDDREIRMKEYREEIVEWKGVVDKLDEALRIKDKQLSDVQTSLVTIEKLVRALPKMLKVVERGERDAV